MGLILGRGIKADTLSGRHLLFEGINNKLRFLDGNGTVKDIFEFSFDVSDSKTTVYLNNKLVSYQAIEYGTDPVSDNELARKAYVDSKVGGLVSGTTWLSPVIEMQDQPDGGEVADARYIVGENPTGDFASFTHGDIVKYDGSAWAVETAVSDLNDGSAVYPTKSGSTNKFYTFSGGIWLSHYFEATTVKTGSVLNLSGLEISLQEASEGQVIVGQGTGAQPLFKAMSGDATINQDGLLTIANSAITLEKIADNAVTNAKINDASITNSKIATGAIYTDKINDGQVTEQKLSVDVQTKLNDRGHDGDGYSVFASQDNEKLTSTVRVVQTYIATSDDETNNQATLSDQNYCAEASFVLEVFGARFTESDNIVFTITNNQATDSEGTHSVLVDWSNNSELSDPTYGIKENDEIKLEKFVYETYLA